MADIRITKTSSSFGLTEEINIEIKGVEYVYDTLLLGLLDKIGDRGGKHTQERIDAEKTGTDGKEETGDEQNKNRVV